MCEEIYNNDIESILPSLETEEDFNIHLLKGVKELNFSGKTTKFLESNNIILVGDLVKFSENELLRFQKFGRKTLNELKQKLATYNLMFGMRVDNWEKSKLILKEQYEDSLNILRKKEAIETIENFLGHKMTTIEDEIEGVIYSLRLSEKEKEIFIMRNGFDQQGIKTLQEVGLVVGGVSRQWIQQIEAKILKKLKHMNLFAPITENVLQIVSNNKIILKSEVEKTLYNKGYTKSIVDLRVLMKLAELLGKEVKFKIENSMLISKNNINDLEKIISYAKKKSSKYGYVYLEDIQDNFLNIKDDYNFTDISKILEITDGFKWLVKDEECFYFQNRENALINKIIKIFSVTNRLDVSLLREALRRHHRVRIVPTKKALLRLCSGIEGFEISENNIFSNNNYEASKKLSDIELKLYHIFEKRGPILNRLELKKISEEVEINGNSFNAFLSSSPIIRRYETGVYGIIGSKTSLVDIESKRIHARKNKVLLDSGWTKDGYLWILYKISDALLNIGVGSVNTNNKGFIMQGDYKLFSISGNFLDNIKVSDSKQFWNLKKALRKLGADTGDYLLTKWDTKNNKVYLDIGNEELLDEVEAI